jgi:hypothetical protein
MPHVGFRSPVLLLGPVVFCPPLLGPEVRPVLPPVPPKLIPPPLCGPPRLSVRSIGLRLFPKNSGAKVRTTKKVITNASPFGKMV